MGVMSRLLSLLLLYKSGNDIGKYISFEEQINNAKLFYYDALKESSQGWEDNKNNYLYLCRIFLGTLYMCYQELNKRLLLLTVIGYQKARIEATVLNSLTPISKAEICNILPDISPTTVEAVLGSMVKNGSIERLGNGAPAVT